MRARPSTGTLTYVAEGAVSYIDPDNVKGTLPAGGVEWMHVAGRASRCRGAHFGDPDAPRSRRHAAPGLGISPEHFRVASLHCNDSSATGGGTASHKPAPRVCL
jgi:hypothetical protein